MESSSELEWLNSDEYREFKTQYYLDDLGLDWDFLQGKRVLDIAAGDAEFAFEARKQNIDVTSTDIGLPTPGSTADIHKDLAYIRANAFNLPFANNSFDMAISECAPVVMVQHAQDIYRLLSEAQRILTDEGEFRFGPGGFRLPNHEIEMWWRYVQLQNHKGERGNLSDKAKDELDGLEAYLSLREQAVERIIYTIAPEIKKLPGNPGRHPFTDYYFSLPKAAQLNDLPTDLPSRLLSPIGPVPHFEKI